VRDDYRHEIKFEISQGDVIAIRQRLGALARRDSHARDGSYLIRSLYFDTAEDTALREKLDGVRFREKFRIRAYNKNKSYLRLEKKTKLNGLGTKDMANLRENEVRKILDGNIWWMGNTSRELVRELYTRMKNQNLRPRVLVDYTREPFVYDPGNVRVTIDSNIRTGLSFQDFFDFECPTIPVKGDPVILEVKWDSFLPSVIRDAVQLDHREIAYSKYASCRMFDSGLC
jgi:hypothetical protein